MAILISVVVTTSLCGCASTGGYSGASSNDWSLQTVGRGVQLGSMSGSAGALAPFIWGSGAILEMLGEVISSFSFIP